MIEFLAKIWEWIKTQMPALGITLYEALMSRLGKERLEKKRAELKLKIKEDHDAIDKQFAGKSDSDIVDEYLRESGGGSDPDPEK